MDENENKVTPPESDASGDTDAGKNVRKTKKKLSNGTKSLIAVIVLLIFSAVAIVGGYINNKLNLIVFANETTTAAPLVPGDEPITEEPIYDEKEEWDEINDVARGSGFGDVIKEWGTTRNGENEHISSKNVINVLLLGIDQRGASMSSGRSDVMMLVSLNRKTKTISLVSFFRDTYVYMQSPSGNRFRKLNATFNHGGPQVVVDNIENYYKIEIDNYVVVNFTSFSQIVEKMGGITIPVMQYEANEINRNLPNETPVGYGDAVKLNGRQALAYCRARHIDSDADVSRTRRQRTVIEAVIKRANEASFSELDGLLDTFLPYVVTGYTKNEILKLSTQALAGNWAGYKVQQLQMPSKDTRYGYSGASWIWVVDFPLAAQQLQMSLYGQTNIELEPNRVTAIDLIGGYVRASSSTIAPVSTTNPADDTPVEDETTTLPGVTTTFSAATTTTTLPPVTTTLPVPSSGN
ncbi:MAG: LCP family protein [Clostridiales bacterium]|nr:LCP family protein [Clostridiales bacterium]